MVILRENVLWTALKQFSGSKCTRLKDFAYAISKNFRGDTQDPRRNALSACTRHQFQLGSSAFLLLLFYETTPVMHACFAISHVTYLIETRRRQSKVFSCTIL